MSRTTVRAAIASFLNAAAITGLQTVYQALPVFQAGELLNLAADGGAGAYAYVELGQASEIRWSNPAPFPGYTGSGTKGVHYPVSIVVVYQYLIPQQLSAPISPDDWVLAEDVILQAIVNRIHSDATLGANGTVFVASQEPDSMRVSPDDPVLEAGKILSNHWIEFRVTEAIQA